MLKGVRTGDKVVVKNCACVTRCVVRDDRTQSLVAVGVARNIESTSLLFSGGHFAGAFDFGPCPCIRKFENQVQLGCFGPVILCFKRQRVGLAQVECFLVFDLCIVSTVGYGHLAVAGGIVNRCIFNLDTRFFAQMVTDGTEITGLTTATPLVDNLESIIQSIETTQNDWVDGVDREMIEISVKPAIYGKLLNYIDSVPNPISGLKEDVFHGVRIYSNHRQTKDIICAIHGAVGQPVTVDDYEPEKIQLSNNYDCSLFYSRGTKAVMPDLIRYANIAEAQNNG